MTSPVTLSASSSVVVITMDDGKVNAFGDTLIDALNDALDEALGTARTRAVVLAGREGVFSGGFDLGVLASGGPAAGALVERGGHLLTRLVDSPVPIVAAATGHAVALGAVVMLACHYRVAADADVRVGLNEVAIGMPLPSMVVELAEQRLDRARRLEAMLLARLWTPREAVAVGFADEVVAPGDVIDVAVAHAKDLGSRLQPDAFVETSRRLRGVSVGNDVTGGMGA